ncbi:MAG TPA: hypothetical protein VML95_09535 [Longimicrobiales bacterium]|nr:hypothetical protein [Longimicrobiales bacterium]
MARKRRKCWSYSAGERGRNRARVYEKEPGGQVYLEWYEDGHRRRALLAVTDHEEAKRRADAAAARFALSAEAERRGSVATLMAAYAKEVTRRKGASMRDGEGRAERVWLAFFGTQPTGRGPERHPRTLDRIDWERFIAARRAGELPGWRAVRDRQVAYDLAYLCRVLTWATGAGRLERHPWDAGVRRAQGWPAVKERNPRRPAMTGALRAGLIEHGHPLLGVILVLERETRRRSSAIRRLLWSDVDLEAGTVRWRAATDKAGRASVTPLTADAAAVLRSLERGIGDVPLFARGDDPTRPASRHTLQRWLRRAKRKWLEAVPEAEREELAARLADVGFHAEKRAGVRDPRFRALPPKVQEMVAGTAYATLRTIYDDLGVEELREAMAPIDTANRHQAGGERSPVGL